MAERITKKECAQRLDLTTRQVTNLVDAGLPREVDGNRVWFLWPAAMHWYIAYKIEAAEVDRAGPDTYEAARARKMAAEAEMAELDLAERRGELLTVAVLEEIHQAPMLRLRASLMNVPGKYAPRMVGLETPAAAQQQLDVVIREVMTELAREDDGDDTDDAPERAA